jgi:RNA polymerase sigma factor (sigma-70 family)
MFVSTNSALRQHCDRRVRALVAPDLAEAHDLSQTALARHVSQIVARNLESGRAQRVIAASRTVSAEQLEPYIDRVIATFLVEHERVDRLAAAEGDEWSRLCGQLTNRAAAMLTRVRQSPATAAEAIDFAQAACESIFQHIFPYDVSFDAWATLILKNFVLQRYTRSRDLLDRNPEVASLDDSQTLVVGEGLSLHDLLADPSAAVFERRDVQDWLLQAITKLTSRAQQQVIVALYFDNRAEAEIAQHLGRSVQAVYNLKYRALRQLKELLQRERNDDRITLNRLDASQEAEP